MSVPLLVSACASAFVSVSVFLFRVCVRACFRVSVGVRARFRVCGSVSVHVCVHGRTEWLLGHFGLTLESLLVHVVDFESLWDHFGMIVESLWVY